MRDSSRRRARRRPHATVLAVLMLALALGASSCGAATGAGDARASGSRSPGGAASGTGDGRPGTGSAVPGTSATPGRSGSAATSASGTAPGGTGPAGADPGTDGTTGRPTTFVVVGDSITAGSEAIVGAEVPGVGSWVTRAGTEPLEFRGGWAVPGATTDAMLAGATELVDSSGLRADALVLLGGTNDVMRGLDREVALQDLVQISDVVGIPDVVLVAIPPLDSDPAGVQDFNQRLGGLATAQGWEFVDPWEGIGDAGVFLPGASGDGIHPVPEAADLVGTRIRSALLYGAGA